MNRPKGQLGRRKVSGTDSAELIPQEEEESSIQMHLRKGHGNLSMAGQHHLIYLYSLLLHTLNRPAAFNNTW